MSDKPIAFTGGWDVIKQGQTLVGDLHVVPRNDIVPHLLTRACGCGPRVEETALRRVVFHHAPDRREHFEDLSVM